MKLIIDTREQTPFTFAGKRYEGVEIEIGNLLTGDYSIAGLEDRVAIERKSLPDLVACLGRERERFERELQRAAGLDCFCVVIEAGFTELARGQYQGRLNAHSACQSIAAFTARLGIPFHFAGSRAAAEYFTYSLLRQYLTGAEKRYKAILAACGAA